MATPQLVLSEYNYNKGKYRGAALVIANSNYPGASLDPSCQMDGQLAFSAFAILGYDVKLVEDCSGDKMLKEIGEFVDRAKKEGSSWDSLVFHFSGHGGRYTNNALGDTDEVMWGLDSDPVFKKDLLDNFTPDKMPTMFGKPKLFVLDCCRGHFSEKLHPTRDFKDRAVHTDRPDYADLIIGQASRPYTTCGSETLDSPGTYTLALYKTVIENFYSPQPLGLTSVMILTNASIADGLADGSTCKESPNFDCYLTKEWYVGAQAGTNMYPAPKIIPDVHGKIQRLPVHWTGSWNADWFQKSARGTCSYLSGVPDRALVAGACTPTSVHALRGEPTSARHAIPEYAPMGGVLVALPLVDPMYGDPVTARRFGLPLELIVHMHCDLLVFILADIDENTQRTVKDKIAQCADWLKVPYSPDHIVFLHINTDSYWTRDFGTWWFRAPNGSVEPIVHQYNRPKRPNDIKATELIAQVFGFTVDEAHRLGLNHTGGNMMEIECGKEILGASTTLVYQENTDKTKDAIDKIVEEKVGLAKYYVLNDPMGTYIGHIDCWAKFLPFGTVVVDQHPLISELDQRAKELESAGLRVYRLCLVARGQAANPYSNSLLINHTLYLPLNSIEPFDSAALSVYAAALPDGYKVVGVPGSKRRPWLGTDALHCRTRGVPKEIVEQWLKKKAT